MTENVIDSFEFCRLKQQRQGEIEISGLLRLSQELAGPVSGRPGLLQWTLQGGADQHGHSQLRLSVAGPVQLMCQRCLLPFEFEIASESSLIIAADDAHADEIDAHLADDAIDVIVGSRQLNIVELVEDEALLALPLAPKHAVCPDKTIAQSALSDKISPFAVLKK